MPALFAATFALAVLLAPLAVTAAGSLDPERAAREARSELRGLLRKQRKAQAVPPPSRPTPARSIGRPKTEPAKSGDGLSTICIGCDAR